MPLPQISALLTSFHQCTGTRRATEQPQLQPRIQPSWSPEEATGVDHKIFQIIGNVLSHITGCDASETAGGNAELGHGNACPYPFRYLSNMGKKQLLLRQGPLKKSFLMWQRYFKHLGAKLWDMRATTLARVSAWRRGSFASFSVPMS